MKRVLIVGSAGAGKSTFSRRFAPVVGLPLVHLDQEFWQSGWVESERPDFDKRLSDILARDEWVIEGSYHRTLPMRLARADTVIHLDYRRMLRMVRIAKRVITSYGKVRFDMADGCPEKVDLSFLGFAWGQGPRGGHQSREIMNMMTPDHQYIRLKSPRDLETWWLDLKSAKDTRDVA